MISLSAPSDPSLSAAVKSFFSTLVAFLRQVPSLEYKKISSDAKFPILLTTRIENVQEVRRVQTYETRNPANSLPQTGIAWSLTRDGLLISEIEGLTRDTTYTVVIAIQGDVV